MSGNYYTIERFKQTIDEEGKETLTKIPYDENNNEYLKKNFININLRSFMNYLRSSYESIIDVDPTTRSFKDAKMLVSASKIYTKALSFRTSLITTDGTYTGKDKFIQGNLLVGESVSPITEGDINVITVKARFNAPASGVRTINSIMLTSFSSSSNTDRAAFSSVLLDAPCIQRDDEVLVITYRYSYNIKELKESSGLLKNPVLADTYCKTKAIGGTHSTASDVLINEPTKYTLSSCSSVDVGREPILVYSPSGINNAIGNVQINDFYEGYKEIKTVLDVNDYNGIHLQAINLFAAYSTIDTDSGLYTSITHYPMGSIKFRKPEDTCVQNTYNKLVSTSVDGDTGVNKPFYDLDNIGNSVGSLTISDSYSPIKKDSSYDIKGNIVELFRTEITSGGASGTCRYKLSKRAIGTVANTSSWLFRGSSYLQGGRYELDTTETGLGYSNNSFDQSDECIGGLVYTKYQIASGMVLPLNLGEFLVFNPTATTNTKITSGGIWVHSTNTADLNFPIKLDTTTVPGFGATDIRGIATAEDGTILVACASTGLWKLKREFGQDAAATVANRITNTGALVDTSCIAVNFVRKGGRFNSDAHIYALFGNELAVSADGGINWSTYNSTTTPAFDLSSEVSDLNQINGITANLFDGSNDVGISVIQGVPIYRPAEGMVLSDSSARIKAVVWNATTGTLSSLISYFVGSGFGRAYCGGNKNLVPVNDGTISWLVPYTSNSTSFSLRGFTSSLTNLTNITDNSKVESYEAVYDEIDAKQKILYVSGSNLKLTSIADSSNSSKGMLHDLFNTGYTNSICFIGRGLLLVSGGLSHNKGVYPSAVNNDSHTEFSEKMSFILPLSFENEESVDKSNCDYYRNNRYNFWYTYGWDGATSKWVLDGSGDKLGHTNKQELIDGLEVILNDDPNLVGNSGNFIAGEVFDTYVCDGVFKDDYTKVTLDSFVFYGSSVIGDEFSSDTIPANPAGMSTHEMSVRYYEPPMNTNSISYSTIVYDRDFITSGRLFGTSSPSFTNNVALVGEPLVGDFEISFRMGYLTPTSVGVDQGSAVSSLNDLPLFGFSASNHDTATNGIFHPINYGFCAGYGEDEEKLRIYPIRMGTTGSLQINHLPNTDIFKWVRTGDTLKLMHNNVELTSFVVPNSTKLQLTYNGLGVIVRPNGSSRAVDRLLSIFDCKVTYNDPRHVIKVGKATSFSGTFDKNFGRLSTTEWERGQSKLYINGTEAVILTDKFDTEPEIGQIRVNKGNGELWFNPADAGKTITGEWRMLPCINSRDA